MTTMSKSDMRFLGLPKNRTGIFAANTVHEVKPARSVLQTVPALSPQFRQMGSTNYFFATAEQNHHQLQQYRLSKNEIQQYYPAHKQPITTVDSSNDSRSTSTGIRNGFRPSNVRHQKLRLTSTTPSQRSSAQSTAETKDLPPKSPFIPSRASARLRSEIDHLNMKIIKNRLSSKSLRFQTNREFDESPRSVFSYSASFRGTSASSVLTADRIHQRFTSAITNPAAQSRLNANDTSNPTDGSPSSPPIPIQEIDEHENDDGDEENSEEDEEENLEYRSTYAYQVPQQTNVGSESIFLNDPTATTISSLKMRNVKYEPKPVSCPFYVMYFTNLAMQQRQNRDNTVNEKYNEKTMLKMPSTIRKVPVNSRTSTAITRHYSSRRPVNSPISMYTHSAIDDDDHLTNVIYTPYAKPYTINHENSHVLRDILRTSSFNNVHV